MKILISPAKSLDLESNYPKLEFTYPIFQKEATMINSQLRKKSVNKLSKLMSISTNLAQINYLRNQEFREHSAENQQSRPAIFCFNGDVYLGIDIKTFPLEEINLLQQNLRILSGLYGLLKPLDQIQAHRLEMGTQMNYKRHKKMSDFWKKRITDAINAELQDGELLVNLASQEYAAAIDFSKIKNPVITPTFKDYKNGKYKTIMSFAKKARGQMTRYLVLSEAKKLSDILEFQEGNYHYNSVESKDYHPVFVR